MLATLTAHHDPSDGDPLFNPRYPRANSYESDWVFENQMVPHCLWLLESLTQVMPIHAGERVLDLGCGRAMSSIFLAKEFGATVSATDLWIDAADNEARIEAAGVADLVTAVHAEAHALPFERESFDVVVSLDAYHYFGTDDLYVGTVAEILRPGGRIGIVVPGTTVELGSKVPDELAPYWEWEFCSFHSPTWWQEHWDKTGRVRVDLADMVPEGWRDWLAFDEASLEHLDGWRKEAAMREAAMLRADQGRRLGFTRVVATKESS